MEELNISVVIPTYNAAPYIEKAVLSALQFPEVKEVIIVEDCSTDNTLEECEKLQELHERVKLFQHEDRKNHGDSITRNLGIEKANCEFVAFLDADDYYLPNRFDAEKKIFEDRKVDGVFGAIGTDFINEKGKKDYIAKFGENFLCTVNFPAEGREIFYNMIAEPSTFGHSFSMIALTLRRSALENPTLRMPPKLTISQDKEFIIRLAFHKYLKTGIIDRPIANRTAHETNSITKIKNHSVSHFNHNAKLYYSLYMWSLKQHEISKEIKEFFRVKYLSNRIAATKGIKKYLIFLRHLPANPQLLRTRYRYYALRQHE